MSPIGAFFSTIRDSFYGPALYASMKDRSLGSAFIFLLLVILLATLVGSVSILGGLFPFLDSFSKTDYVAKYYPEGLVITLKGGEVSTNQEEPYILPVSAEMKPKEGEPKNILAIDTRPDITLEALGSYDAFMTLTKHEVIFTDDNERRVFSLKSMPDLILGQATAEKWMDIAKKFVLAMSIPLAIVGILMVVTFTFSYHLMASLLGAVIAILIGMLFQKKLSYGEGYKTALFATVPVIVLGTVAGLFGVPALPFLLSLLIFVAVLFVNLSPKQV